MDFFVHILPNENCLLQVGNYQSLLKQEKINTFKLSSPPKNLAFTFLPAHNPQQQAQIIVINLQTCEIYPENDNIQLIKFAPDVLLLKISSTNNNLSKPYNIKTKNISFAGQTHSIFWSKFEKFLLHIENNEGQFLDVDYDAKIEQLEYKTLGENILLYAKTLDNKYLVCHIEYKNKVYKCLCLEKVDLLEIDKNTITTYKDLLDTAHHGQTKEYKFDTKFSVSKTLVCSQADPVVVRSSSLIHFCFTDAIKAQDYDLARKYLTPKLSSQLSDTHLKTFFEDFLYVMQNILPSSSQNDLAFIYKGDKNYYAKVFSFQFENNLICNIVEK